MSITFRALIFAFALLTGVVTSFTVFADDDIFDRLDGTGPSHKKVDVIEWEGNLEIHAYPKGSLSGLSVKLDDRTEGKKVMVIGYRFTGMKTPLVRRAILGTPFNKNLKAFIDPTNKEFDKLAISNDNLTKPFVAYKLDPAPKQWYPDGDPRNDDDAPATDGAILTGVQPQSAPQANPAANANPKNNFRFNLGKKPANPSTRVPASAPPQTNDSDDGTIKNFSW